MTLYLSNAPVGTNYYLDATGGNDSNNGLSAGAAWKTMTKANAASLQPDDHVLLKCGEIFKGVVLTIPASGTLGHPITFDVYGTGANPIIDPTITYTDFTIDSGSIWRRSQTLTQNINQVFEDGVRLIYAANKASMVQGSWSFATGSPGTIYVWCTDSGNPNSGHVIDYQPDSNGYAGAIDYNSKSYITFNNIDTRKANKFGYKLWNASVDGSNWIVRNSTNSLEGAHGIYVNGCGDTLIANCVSHDVLDTGFWLGHASNIIFDSCESYNAGLDVSPTGKLYPVATHWPNGILASALAVDCIIRHCYIHDCYNGSALLNERSGGQKSTRQIIDGNLIDTRNGDTPAIHIEGINTVIRNNIVYHDGSNAVVFTNAPTAPEFYHNTFISSGTAHSVDCGTNNPGMIFKNNIVIRNGGTGRYISVPATSQAGTVIDYNCWYGASTQRWFWGPNERTAWTGANSWVTTDGQDTHGLNADPVFVTPNTDLHLQVTSPCKTAGAAVGVLTDYDSQDRSLTTPSTGAYEYP